VKLRYETGTATLIQFLVVMLLGFVNLVAGIIEGCRDSGASGCIEGTIIPLVYVLILAGWFGFIAMLGYAAQDQRSHKLARFLMAIELLVLVVALFNAKHFPNVLGLITSLTDAIIAGWIIVLAWRLSRAKGGRITVPASRPRRRATAKH
jgi:hypothetical protein